MTTAITAWNREVRAKNFDRMISLIGSMEATVLLLWFALVLSEGLSVILFRTRELSLICFGCLICNMAILSFAQIRLEIGERNVSSGFKVVGVIVTLSALFANLYLFCNVMIIALPLLNPILEEYAPEYIQFDLFLNINKMILTYLQNHITVMIL